MIGIYKFENKINHHIYIGQSIDIERRRKQHHYEAHDQNQPPYNSQFHQALRKYGKENFDFEIIAEISPEEYSKEMLNELEIFFIDYYDSYKNGYNATPGGDKVNNENHKGEKNGRALLTENEVKYIRECYNAHIPFKEVYAEFQHKISKRGFQNVWWFKTWKHIYPEFHNEENKYWHSHQAKANSSEVARQNQRQFSEKEVRLMRRDFDQGMSPKEVWKKYAPDKAWSTIYNIVTRHTYKDIK